MARALSRVKRPANPIKPIDVERRRDEGLAHEIARKLGASIKNGQLKPGTKLPSVRAQAEQLGVSTFTVVGAYDLLVARNLISAKRGTGYFVLSSRNANVFRPESESAHASSISDFWLSTDVFAHGRLLASPGCGWLPSDWYSERTFLGEAIRRVARTKPEQLINYGHPAGYNRLRQHIAQELIERTLKVSPEQIILTNGATHALDLVVRTCLKPNDAVLVESPGYSNLNGLIARHGCTLLPVRRTSDGLDLEGLAELARTHHPKAMFVTTVLHNPLGTTLTPTDAHRLLALAEKFDFLVVEDDVSRRFASDLDPCLAAMDGLERVISVSGFSKTVAPSLRVGYLACKPTLAEQILRTKMVNGLTTSEINERIVLEVLLDPNHRRIINRIARRLVAAREAYKLVLEASGLSLLAIPAGGMFLSAGWSVPPTPKCSARLIAEQALDEGLMLAPGDFFHASQPESVWFRFNVAHKDTNRLQDFLRRVPSRYNWW